MKAPNPLGWLYAMGAALVVLSLIQVLTLVRISGPTECIRTGLYTQECRYK